MTMSEIIIKCRRCPKLHLKKMHGNYRHESPRYMASCRAVNNVLKIVDYKGDEHMNPTRANMLKLRIKPDVNCPEIQKLRRSGDLMWAQASIHPDGSIQRWDDNLLYT